MALRSSYKPFFVLIIQHESGCIDFMLFVLCARWFAPVVAALSAWVSFWYGLLSPFLVVHYGPTAGSGADLGECPRGGCRRVGP